MSSIGEGSLTSGSDDTNRPAYSEQPRTSLTEHQKYMAEHSGKDILSSDVEIKGSIKFQKELLIDGKVEGEINSEGVLTIGENADIRGEIKTKSITVFGGSNHDDILGRDIFAQLRRQLLAAPAVADGDGHGPLGRVLADDV